MEHLNLPLHNVGQRENRRKLTNIFPVFSLIYHFKEAIMHTVLRKPQPCLSVLFFARNDAASAGVGQLVQTIFTVQYECSGHMKASGLCHGMS